MNIGKLIGCTMIVIGTTIGAGILALPTQSAAAGFPLASILMLAIWVVSTITALMIAEVNLAFPVNSCSLGTMTEQTLGTFWRIITWILYLLLLYTIDWAYVSGGSLFVAKVLEAILHTKTPSWINIILFTLILGTPVFLGTKVVDYFNRGLLSLKGFLLVAALALIVPRIDVDKLAPTQIVEQSKYLWIAAPIFAFAFFYHIVIPSLRIYVGDRPKEIRQIIIWGSVSCLILYLLWLASTLGTVPLIGENSFTSLAQNHATVVDFIQTVATILNNKFVTSSIGGFSAIAMTTSFLGVSLGLFDFLADGFKLPDTKVGRLKTSGLTFIPPIILALLYPNGFILALNYASIFITILFFIFPPLMVYQLRKNPQLKSQYRLFGGNTLLAIVFLIGIVLLVLAMMSSFHILPHMH